MIDYPRELGFFTGEKDFSAHAYEETKGGRCYMIADFDVDVDGSGDSHGDPYFQPDTTLHRNGKPLNSDLESFIVLPPACILGVQGIVLGCQAYVTYNGMRRPAVVGDVGPSRKVGEGSYRLAKLLGMNPSPINGGVDGAHVRYEWYPNVAAVVDGITYTLQPYK